VKKAEQAQYPIYPSKDSPGKYRLWRKSYVKKVKFKLFEKERGGEVRDTRARCR
jgi:hypothetical protein